MFFLVKIFVYLIIFSVTSIFYFEQFCHEPQDTPLCGRFPQEKDIIIDNHIWQTLFAPNETYRLLNAHYDDRRNETNVRITMLMEVIGNKTIDLYCQFWLDEEPGTIPIVVKATQIIKIYPDRE